MDAKVRVYPHNDLLNLAWYHLDVIRGKQGRGESEGLSLDAMSCIIAMAFSVEALLNYVGFKRVPDWRERSSYETKFRAVQDALGLEVRWEVEPFRTLRELKELRDQMAHGKPREVELKDAEDQPLSALLRNPWDDHLKPDFVASAYDQVIGFETQLLKRARIQAEHAVTHGTTKRTTKLASGPNIEIKSRRTHGRSSSARPRKPPQSIRLDAEALAKIDEALTTMSKAMASPLRHGSAPRTRFPRHR